MAVQDDKGRWRRAKGEAGGGQFARKDESGAALPDRFPRKDAGRGTARPPKSSPPRSASPPVPVPEPRRGRTKPDTGNAATLEATRARLRAASLDELLDGFATISKQPPSAAVDRALLELDAELARREGVDKLTVQDDHQSRQIDDLVGRGWSYTDAYAEVHHLDPAQLAREERMQLVDAERRPGERRDATIRRMYAETVYLQWMQAEEATNGNLLSAAGRARDQQLRRKGGAGLDPATLWSGPSARAAKYASDELKAWWSANGGRRNAAEFRAQFTGDRAARDAARQTGAGRDYGV